MSSRAMKKVASADKEMNMILTIKRIGDRTFNLRNGVWVENGIEEDVEPDKRISFLSPKYFSLSKSDSELRRILALGEQVMFRWDGKIYEIVK